MLIENLAVNMDEKVTDIPPPKRKTIINKGGRLNNIKQKRVTKW